MRIPASLTSVALVAFILLSPAAIAASSPSSYVQVKGLKTSFVAGTAPRIFVSAVDGSKALTNADGWIVDARLRRPNDAVTSLGVEVITGTKEWTLYPEIPMEPGDYLLRVMFYCNASFLPCAKDGTMVSLTEDIPFAVTAAKAKSSGRTLKFPITAQTTTAAQVNKEDGLTEVELATILLKKDSKPPRIDGATIEGVGCSDGRLIVDIATNKGDAPDSSSPGNVQLYDYFYFRGAKNYGAPVQWEYWQSTDGGYQPTLAYGVKAGQANVHLLEAREGQKSTWKLLTVTCEKNKLKARLSEPKRTKVPKTSPKSSSRSSSKSSNSTASSISTANWKAYDDDTGTFSVKLPKSWKLISGYDGSYLDFTTVAANSISGFGDPKSAYSVGIELNRSSDVNTQGKTLLQYAEQNMVFVSRYEPGAVTKGSKWTMYEYNGRTDDQYKVLFDFGGSVLVLSFPSHDATADGIIGSITLK
jgi:hypothetical protein